MMIDLITYKAKDGDVLMVKSMNKVFRVTMITTSDKVANERMAVTDEAVIATFGPFIILAEKYGPEKE